MCHIDTEGNMITNAAAATLAGNPVFTSATYVSDSMSVRALLAAELVMTFTDPTPYQEVYFRTAELQGYEVANAWLIGATAHLFL
ncbi:hypothetical protein RER_39670 [Rhodococcus erythropolis PR4]|uniref:Uncharacterized protein n=2 Tax=Rhodococcus erythropolis TaxID=1833 RepID=C1A240_RHOE4|nr:hypothetical protein RER_39670 [Rhodococcus erythropolis PR4]